MTEIEQEVSEALASDPNYPLGEQNAMKWAVAWRLIRDRNGINANASNVPGEDIDGWMVGWFANAMATAEGRGYEQGKLAQAGMVPPDTGASDTSWDSRNHPDRVADYEPA